jgi:peptidoglycan/LPS O-acetylase OafA/YrhL
MLAIFCLYIPFHRPTPALLFSYLPLFMNGFLLFQRVAGIIGAREFWLWSLLLIATTFTYSVLMPGLALVTVYLLLQGRFHTRVTAFLGNISYSLYLVHAPIALLQAGALPYLDGTGQHVALAMIAMALSIFAAWIFYLLVERPSIDLSKRIQYRRPVAGSAEGVLPTSAIAPPVAADRIPPNDEGTLARV